MKSGLLQMYSARTDTVNPEEHLLRIAALIAEHRPRCMVIDPLSAISRTGALSAARAIGNRLIYKLHDHGITAFDHRAHRRATMHGRRPPSCRSRRSPTTGSSCPTWCAAANATARSPSSSRAAPRHSNQVRELILSDTGLALADVYTAGGEVLMGTLRWEKEAEERARAVIRRNRIRRTSAASCSLPRRIPPRASPPCNSISRGSAPRSRSNTRDDAARHVSSGEQQTEVRRLRGANGDDIAVSQTPGASAAAR